MYIYILYITAITHVARTCAGLDAVRGIYISLGLKAICGPLDIGPVSYTAYDNVSTLSL